MKKVIAVLSLICVVMFMSGCIQSDACKRVEEEMAAQNVTCKCSSSDTGDLFPNETENMTEGEKCYCICIKDGISIKAITPKPTSGA